MASKKIKIITNPVADKYSNPQEKTIEFSSPNGGGLINFYMNDQNELIVCL